MDIEIRLFKAGDEALVKDFYDRMGYETRFFFNPIGSNYHRTMRFFSDQPDDDILHWMAVKDGRMVGYVFVWDIHHGIVEMGIAVADDYKGKHLGRQLIDTIKAWCVENGKGGILLTTHAANTRAQMLYLQCGFKHIGVSDNRHEQLYLFNLPMEVNE